MARQAPEGLLGIHINLLLNIPPEIVRSIAAGDPAPEGLSEKEKAAYGQRKALALAYLIEHSTRPQTIGYSLADSPVGLAGTGQLAVKNRINAITLAPAEDFRRDSDLFGEGVRAPEAQSQIQAAMKRGFQTRDAEMGLARMLGELADHGSNT